MAYINGNKILNVQVTGLVNIDQTYDPNSENPQSGKAVAEAINEKLGDIETALDTIIAEQEAIIAIQKALIGGDGQ